MTRSRRLFLPIALEIVARKWPWHRPSTTILLICSSASRSCGLQALLADGWISFSSIVQQRLHVLNGRREGERRHCCALAVERQNVVGARGAIAEDEDLAPAFGAQAHEVVAQAAQETGEVEIPSFE